MINIRQEIQNISQPSNKRKLDKISSRLRLLSEKAIISKEDIEANILDILKSLKYLLELNESDMGTMRLDLGNLLRFEESRFYFY